MEINIPINQRKIQCKLTNAQKQQVLRYTALGLGIFYGVTHQRSITLTQRAAAEKREYEHKQSLIQKAKEEFAKKNAPATTSATKTGGREFLLLLPFLS